MVTADLTSQKMQCNKPPCCFDKKRAFVMTTWAMCCVVPARYYVIQFWDRMLANYPSILKGLCTNQTLTFILLPAFMTVSTTAYSLLNTHQLPPCSKIRDKLATDFIPCWMTMSCFWTPVHTFNFIFVPCHYRVLFASLAQFLSNAFLSFVQFGDFKQFKNQIFLRGK